ncbi:MAG: aromatic amino acid transport family protein [Patescibacteria group bacterium]
MHRHKIFYTHFLLPLGILAATIIGAGFFSLPYFFSSIGIGLGFLLLALAGLAYTIFYFLYADIVVRTKGEHRFIGYARMYLGQNASYIAVATSILGMVFSLTIYLVLSVSFIDLIFPAGPPLAKAMIFWAIGSMAVFFRVKSIALSEFLVMVAIAAIILFLGAIGLPELSVDKLTLSHPLSVGILVPLGAILFSLSGRAAIPEILGYFKALKQGNGRVWMKKILAYGVIVPITLYSIFILAIIALSGTVAEDAVSSLVGSVHPAVLIALGILGLLSIWSSYITVGIDIISSLHYDLHIRREGRFLLVILAPLLFYLFGLTSFVRLVAVSGGIFLSIEGLLVILMWKRANAVLGNEPIFAKHISNLAIGFAAFIFSAALVGQLIQFL